MNIKKVLTYGGWPLLAAPWILLFLGMGMNEAAIFANHFQMPFINPGGVCPAQSGDDIVHTCMNAHSHLKLLSDIFISDKGAASVGDILQDLADGLQAPFLYVWMALLAFCAWTKNKFYLE